MTQTAYTVVDTRTDRVVATATNAADAYRRADQRDQAYGAVCTRVERNYDVMNDDEFAAMMQRMRAERVAA